MATPFTLGNVMKVLGNNMLYLKNVQVVDSLAKVNTLVFDKTGTLTRLSHNLSFSSALNKEQAQMLYALTGHSSHPGSMGEHMMSHYIDMFFNDVNPNTLHGEQDEEDRNLQRDAQEEPLLPIRTGSR